MDKKEIKDVKSQFLKDGEKPKKKILKYSIKTKESLNFI